MGWDKCTLSHLYFHVLIVRTTLDFGGNALRQISRKLKNKTYDISKQSEIYSCLFSHFTM